MTLEEFKAEESNEHFIPDYYPLHRSKLEEVERFRLNANNNREIEEAIKSIKQTAEEYIISSLTTHQEIDDGVLNASLESMKSLLLTKQNLRLFEASLGYMKGVVRNSAREDQPLSFDTLEYYGLLDPSTHLQVSDEVKSQLAKQKSDESSLLDDADYIYLKSIMFVTKNPEEAIPDDNEDDELAVEGGKVSLKDPLTMRQLEVPVVADGCGHVFERESILAQLASNSNCPVPGCTRQLTRSSLHDDKVTKMRLLAFRNLNSKNDEQLDML